MVHSHAVPARDVTMLHGVTLGVTAAHQTAPTLEDGVYVGAGACALGSVFIGSRAEVGATPW